MSDVLCVRETGFIYMEGIIYICDRYLHVVGDINGILGVTIVRANYLKTIGAVYLT